ncbi:serine/threonine-protein kinase [Flectobacillus major]|uniref:serine/threonine-protein kinase n=1 Tax=Flectobacillus major TaxID=103 RepID=UPI0005C579B4|nr:serine/threonine-protein kinase [Flectobacillus major]
MPEIYLKGRNASYNFNPFPPNSPIGQGGMGKVYAGKHSDGTPVAIKVLFAELATESQFVERFVKEALIQTNLNHPNIIKSYDFVVANGKYHIISRLINGSSIEQYLKSNQEIETKIKLFGEVLDALDFLHSQNPKIIHRDIKPANIMVENGKAIVMDLGVAKVTGGKRQTKVGLLMGTPQYSPPEQIRGESHNINPTTDIYATGITFYELLAGHPPFDGTNEYSIMEMQVKNTIPLHRSIPLNIYNVLRKATAKQQNQRYQSALEFKNALLKAIDQEEDWWGKLKSILVKNITQ